MHAPQRPPVLELLAPARDADIGIEALRHGADAVYIGGPDFGARSHAGNPLAEIERLIQQAHRYRARVFVTLNTLLKDEELEPARRLVHQLHAIGADALIVQDMGLLELDLPPIELHASTQADIRTPAKARFLQEVGFSQLVLARELSLPQIGQIAAHTDCLLEFFVHGALCVAYSGQCYISHAHTGRSANRGECSQACRLPYDLTDLEGRPIARDRHLLSMKDNDQSANLAALIEAGIRSFKIEGRLKDMAYVKNVTAHYRQLLDAFLEQHSGWRAASDGRCAFLFTPRPEKTFNRGRTDYFVHGRQPGIGAFDTPAFTGEAIGQVVRRHPDSVEIDGDVPLHNGDGLSFFDAHGQLCGVRLNRVEGRRLFPNGLPDALAVGSTLYRNHDQAFERALEKQSADRRIAIDLRLERAGHTLCLTATDADGHRGQARLSGPFDAARDAGRARRQLHDSLGKLGNTLFVANRCTLHGLEDDAQVPFLSASAANALRRDALAALEAAREAARPRGRRRPPAAEPPPYPDSALSYLGNVLNHRARAFYARHGVSVIEPAYECNQEKGEVSLMITRHCLRYDFNLCPKEVKGVRPDPLVLLHGRDRLTLRFDCKKCEMHVMGKLRRNQPLMLRAHPG